MKKNNRNDTVIIIVIAVIVLVAVTVLVLVSGNKPSLSSLQTTGSLNIGDSALSFSLLASNGSEISLAQYQGKPIILYFNEGVGCQPCWQQIINLEKDVSFTTFNVPLVTITPNALSLWESILNNNPIKSPILADTNNTVSRSYGMLSMKSSMHNGTSPGHTFMLLDKDHKIVWIGDYPQMNMPVSEIISVIKNKLNQ